MLFTVLRQGSTCEIESYWPLPSPKEPCPTFDLPAKKAGFDYPVLEGRDTIVAALLGSLAALDTSHSVSNPRVFLSGDLASLDALVEAQHVPRADHTRHYLMKNRYDVELVRQEDAWAIQRVTIDNIWRTGDPSVLAGI